MKKSALKAKIAVFLLRTALLLLLHYIFCPLG